MDSGPFPIVLRPPAWGTAYLALCSGFFLVVLGVTGMLMTAWSLCILAAAALAGVLSLARLRSRRCICFYADRVTEHTFFSRHTYSYAAMEAILRRTWTTARQPGGAALNRTAICLKQKGRTVIVVPYDWEPVPRLRQAVDFLDSLPIVKHYL